MLDLYGNPIVSSLIYTLEPVQASLPTTPMAMRVMFHKDTQGATFTDCATGKRVPVADSERLAQGDASAGGT